MSIQLTVLQRRLCNLLQSGIPICRRPFGKMAAALGASEDEVLKSIRKLKDEGIIRRIGALINHRALGKVGTLAAAHIEDAQLPGVIEAVNKLEGVSHNYLRKHHLNLWFTLQADSEKQIRMKLSELACDLGVDFYNLPVEKVFKLNVRFDAEDEGRVLPGDFMEDTKAGMAELSDLEKLVLGRLQKPLEPVVQPFDALCDKDLKIEGVLEVISCLINKGVIRRIAAVVDHKKLLFVANVLFVAKLRAERIDEAGRRLAGFGIVSHCYQRRTAEGWPYNLYAMMHGRSMGQIQHVLDKFITDEVIEDFELLPTETELKKEPIKNKFG